MRDKGDIEVMRAEWDEGGKGCEDLYCIDGGQSITNQNFKHHYIALLLYYSQPFSKLIVLKPLNTLIL